MGKMIVHQNFEVTNHQFLEAPYFSDTHFIDLLLLVKNHDSLLGCYLG
jgi:hypothetical protein